MGNHDMSRNPMQDRFASMSVSEYLPYASNRSPPPITCVPKPTGLASVISLVSSALLSKYDKVSAFAMLLFRASKALCCSAPHTKGVFFLVSL